MELKLHGEWVWPGARWLFLSLCLCVGWEVGSGKWACTNTEPAPALRTATLPDPPGTGENTKLREEVPFEQSLEKSSLRRGIIPGG